MKVNKLVLFFVLLPLPLFSGNFHPVFLLQTDNNLFEADAFFIGRSVITFLRKGSALENWYQIDKNLVVKISRLERDPLAPRRARNGQILYRFIDADRYNRDFVALLAKIGGRGRDSRNHIRRLEFDNFQMKNRLKFLQDRFKKLVVEGNNVRLDLSRAMDEIVKIKLENQTF